MDFGENRPGNRDSDTVRNWHALYTRHQHEKAAAQTLSNFGHEVFLPLTCVAHRWQDRTKRVWLPLFPCYVFIRGGFDRRIQILSTPGVISPVTNAGRPAVIPRVQIEAVRRVIESALEVEAHPYLRSGDHVRVVAGPLRSIEGILVRMKGVSRLVVSIDMLGTSAAVEVDLSCIEAVRPSSRRTNIQSIQVSTSGE
jgi:transcription antitermination factor NusG